MKFERGRDPKESMDIGTSCDAKEIFGIYYYPGDDKSNIGYHSHFKFHRPEIVYYLNYEEIHALLKRLHNGEQDPDDFRGFWVQISQEYRTGVSLSHYRGSFIKYNRKIYKITNDEKIWGRDYSIFVEQRL